MNLSASTNQTLEKQYKCLGCENLKDALTKMNDGFNNSDTADLCICTDDIHSKTDVWQEVPALRWMLLIYALCITVGGIGNAMTLITMATADRKTKTVTNVFLISLAIADLLLLFVAAPMDMVHYFARGFDIDGGACKAAEYSRVLSAVASIMNLLAVTIERFIVIVMPMKARSICTMSNSRKSLFGVWGLSLVLAAPILLTKSVYPLHFGDTDGNYVTQYYCNDYDDRMSLVYTIYQLVVCFALPALLMIVCYSVVIKELWKSNKNMSILANASSSTKKSKLSLQGSNELSRRKTVSEVTSPVDGSHKSIERSLTATRPVSTRLNSIPENTNLQNKKYKTDGRLSPYASRKSIDESNHLVATRNLKSLPRTCSLECSNTTIKQHTKQNINDNSQKADDVRQSRTQVIKMLICVIVLFLLCWGPRFILEILMKIGAFKYTPGFYWTKVSLFMLPFMHAIFNPVVYFIMSKSFHQSTLSKFRQCCSFMSRGCCHKNSSSDKHLAYDDNAEMIALKEHEEDIPKYVTIQALTQEQ